MPNRDEAATFFELLYHGCTDGFISILTRWNSLSRRFHVSDIDDAADYACKLALDIDVYFGFGLRRTKSSERLNNIMALPGFFIDIDTAANNPHKSNLNYPPTCEQALAIVDSFHVAPTIIVSTGLGLQVYYITDQPIAIHDEASSKYAGDLLTRFQQYQRTAATSMGYEIRNTASLPMALRVPGTFNKGTSISAPVMSFYSPAYLVAE